MSDFASLITDDEHDRQLIANVHPSNWTNPRPTGRYNLVVIGAGTAGLVTAAAAAGLGAKVALIERSLMGGDCLNVGCVPSKGLLSAARVVASVRDAERFGIRVPAGVEADFGAAMQRMRRLRARISPADSADRFRRLGVDVYLGEAEFVDSGAVTVAGTRLEFKRAVIATGARAAAPPIRGLDDVPYHTNETIFALTQLPPRLGVIGAGPIGCEMAQAFARFGSQVTLIENEHGVLPREDRDAAEIVQRSLERDGVRLLCCGRKLEVSRSEPGIRLQLESHDQTHDVTVDQLLVATGRAANVERLNLSAVGVVCDQHGVVVNDRLQTTNPRIYAAGDVCSRYKFTHAADFMARIVVQNALFLGRRKASRLIIPWCTYTSPELARVGMIESEAADQRIEVETFTQEFRDIDRAFAC
ncbi:MAG: mercuric reductase [Pirellulaceae bacterium]